MNADMHPEVLAIARDFKAIGLSTPGVALRKGTLLLQPRSRDERVAVVVLDAVRCSTTLLSVLAAGARAVTICIKGGHAGTTRPEAEAIAMQLGLHVALGGELHGQPIPGGAIGNSPRSAIPGAFVDRLMHFSSTNFGTAFTTVTRLARSFNEAGGRADVFVAAFTNVNVLADRLRDGNYERFFVACGAFYDFPSLEDLVLSGELLWRLDLPMAQMDDEARAMAACFHNMRDPQTRIVAFQTNWIGRCLQHFGMAGDIDAVVSGAGMCPSIIEAMYTLVPTVRFLDGIPVIIPEGL